MGSRRHRAPCGPAQGRAIRTAEARRRSEARLLTVRRSYDNDTTKGDREEAVPIAAALMPHLEPALEASKGSLLFPRADGEMRTEADKLGKHLHSALSRAGIVEGYLHLCRRCKRKGTPHEE